MNFKRKINERLWLNNLDGCISEVRNVSESGTPLWKVQILLRKPYFWNVSAWKKIYDSQRSIVNIAHDVVCEVIFV